MAQGTDLSGFVVIWITIWIQEFLKDFALSLHSKSQLEVLGLGSLAFQAVSTIMQT